MHIESSSLRGEGTSFQILEAYEAFLSKGIISTDGDVDASPNGRVVIKEGLVHHGGDKTRIIKIALKDLLAQLHAVCFGEAHSLGHELACRGKVDDLSHLA